ncbi:MAG: sugar diacid recognition domain-containing protein [Pyramidobacter sp.]|nr:sugar diacid recognition domain-containing protein [Pyramidobacter sp.]
MEDLRSEGLGLLQKCAQEIAVSTASALSCNVIITDMNGVIIGANCTERIGGVCEAALPVLKSGQPCVLSPSDDATQGGAVPSVTCPIQLMSGRTLGTLTIAGPCGEIEAASRIVRKQTEILLRERELYAYTLNRENQLQNIVQELASFAPGISSRATLTARAADFGYDESWYYVPIIVDLYQFGRLALQIRKESLSGSREAEAKIMNIKNAVLAGIRSVFSHRRDISAASSSSSFVVLHAVGNGEESVELKADAAQLVRAMTEELLRVIEGQGLKACVGVGAPALGVQAVAGSLQELRKALFLGKKFCQGPGVYNISSFRLQEVISSVDATVRNRFIQSVTGKMRRYPDWEEMRETIREWCESDFSLIEASRRLNIHRNTLIYRLEKISRIAEVDMKDFKTCFSLYLALVMEQYVGTPVKEKGI